MPERRRLPVLGHRKILRDLRAHRGRSALVVLAIAAGLVGAGSVLTQYSLVRGAVDAGYAASRPPSATVVVDALPADAVGLARAVTGVADADVRGSHFGRIYVGQRPYALVLTVADDLAGGRIGIVDRQRGTWPPPAGSVAIERSSLPLVPVEIGERVAIRLPGGEPRPVQVSGVVRDVGVAPGWMEHVVYAYGSPSILGEGAALDRLRFVAADRHLPEPELRRLAARVAAALERAGATVLDVQLHLDHVHARQMSSFLIVKGAMGLLALVLAGLLAFSFAAALLADQRRQIGVMKAVGGGAVQIAGIYLGLMALLGALASVPAVPIAAALGRRMAGLSALALNFDLEGAGLPLPVLAAQLAAGLLVPVAGAAYPVFRGVRMTVAEALRDHGSVERTLGDGTVGRLFGGVAGRSRPLLLSLRNSVRHPGRAVVTLAALAAGGAIFVGSLNLRGAIARAVDELFESVDYDLSVTLRAPESRERLSEVIGKLPWVVAVETGSRAQASRIGEDGSRSDSFPVLAPPPDSRLVDYPLVEGRWLRGGAAGDLVANTAWARAFPEVAVGDRITLAIDGRPRSWRLVGVVRSASTGAVAFAHFDDLTAWLGEEGMARTALVRVDPENELLAAHLEIENRSRGGSRSAAVPEAVARAHGPAPSAAGEGDAPTPEQVLGDLPALMESVLEGWGGLEIAGARSVRTARAGLRDHVVMVVDFLLYMSLLVLAVGGCGLATTMSLAVVERTREIGVLRAIGASHRSIAALLLAEGLLFGVATWALALVAAVPVGRVIGGIFGGLMLGSDVGFAVTPDVAGLWLLVVLAISALATALPARSAVRRTAAAALGSS